MIVLENPNTSPERLAEIEQAYAGQAVIGDLLAMLYALQWKSVRDGLPPLINGVKPMVDIKSTNPDGSFDMRWFGQLHWHDPPQFTTADGHLIVVNNGETWWRPL